MKAIVVDPNASAAAHLAMRDVEPPQPAPSEAVVRVAALSLNRGEVNVAQSPHAPAGMRLGWDIAGTVEQPAADGSGPKAGARVVGFMATRGGWAEQVAAPTNALAELPEGVSFAQAATLPVAGLTALYCLEKGSGLIGKNVLVTGATGGVGDFAVQLARLGGARVVAQVRREEQVAFAQASGAHEVAVSEDGLGCASFGPYDLIVDGVGGVLLGNVMGMLGPRGVCVAYGATTGAQVSFDLRHFFLTGGLSLYGFILFHEVGAHPASLGLRRLAELVASGALRPHIEVEADWAEIGPVAQRLLDRGFMGKAVLHVQ